MRLFLCLALFAQATALAAADDSPPKWMEITSRLDAVVPRLIEKHKTPGVSIALVDSKRIVWAKGYGACEAGDARPVETDTVFEACSMSKPLFAYAAMKLIENGQLDLDRPLVQYLEKTYLENEPRHEKITARMVLAHTTGFPNWRPGGRQSGEKLVVNFEPGTRFGYSGEGFWYLQQVVEHIVGEPLEPWIQRTLLQPLAMTHSGYVWRPEFAKIAAAGHTAEGQVKTDRPLYSRGNAAFSLYTTPSDYARFLVEMMSANGTVPHSLRSETIDAMLTPQPVASTRKNEARGLGWALSTLENDRSAFHSGSNGTGFRCHSRFDRATGSGMVIMTNAASGAKVWAEILATLSADGGAVPAKKQPSAGTP